jgi:uncharacterized membrane protein YccC
MSSSDAGRGIATIILCILVASAIISGVTGEYGHWIPVVLGIVVGLMAVRSIGG